MLLTPRHPSGPPIINEENKKVAYNFLTEILKNLAFINNSKLITYFYSPFLSFPLLYL